jgi:hypothetical protein
MAESRERESSSLGFFLIRALIPFMRTPPFSPSYFLKSLPPNIIILGVKVSTCILEGLKYSLQSIS